MRTIPLEIFLPRDGIVVPAGHWLLGYPVGGLQSSLFDLRSVAMGSLELVAGNAVVAGTVAPPSGL